MASEGHLIWMVGCAKAQKAENHKIMQHDDCLLNTLDLEKGPPGYFAAWVGLQAMPVALSPAACPQEIFFLRIVSSVAFRED
ncbi:hypothetical protein EGR_09720 [Echinococcus granulosus]|uniref:Uncharacterized protein n=1 Tax=Echinococcus granulosus TaxID=6210 RepID=W6UPS7_ECHGR|nr:hypothetical protein EGR_09720 [Echinococcus granulosus]EUB55409.1 hypothetical protein EGR_09720 [Echinococcus granulosus]